MDADGPGAGVVEFLDAAEVAGRLDLHLDRQMRHCLVHGADAAGQVGGAPVAAGRRSGGHHHLGDAVEFDGGAGDLGSIQDLYDAGTRSIGIHVESLDDAARLRWMPGKGTVPMAEYQAAWAEAVRVFGWNQVSTYILIGLGEDPDELVAGCEELIAMGVYPFVVPYRPLAGTLAREVDHAPAPPHDLVYDVTSRVAAALRQAGMLAGGQAAGCAACGACSALSACAGDESAEPAPLEAAS